MSFDKADGYTQTRWLYDHMHAYNSMYVKMVDLHIMHVMKITIPLTSHLVKTHKSDDISAMCEGYTVCCTNRSIPKCTHAVIKKLYTILGVLYQMIDLIGALSILIHMMY